MGDFKFLKTELDEVYLIESQIFGDERGFFCETYKNSEFIKIGMTQPIVQVNHSKSGKGVLRGLHYQISPKSQGKLIKIMAGEIFDVAVDIRKRSPFFGKWVGQLLSAENKKMLYIPKGFAHGFLVLSDSAEMIYFADSSEYSPEHDRGIIWNDKAININWPLNLVSGKVVLSSKDQNHPSLSDAEIFA